MRIDKWLWAARFFKTRALASRSCELGRIATNDQTVKASREVRVGDRLRISTDRGPFELEVLGLSEMRGPAAVAQTLYRETEASIAERRLLEEQRKAAPTFDYSGEGRPSKRNRRELDRVRGRD